MKPVVHPGGSNSVPHVWMVSDDNTVKWVGTIERLGPGLLYFIASKYRYGSDRDSSEWFEINGRTITPLNHSVPLATMLIAEQLWEAWPHRSR